MSTTGRRGNCYVTCEALYHLLGGKKAGWVPHRVKHEGDTHWYLVRRQHSCPGVRKHRIWCSIHETVVDPTASQFETKPDYRLGKGSGFLTRRPSKRARALMKVLLWQK